MSHCKLVRLDFGSNPAHFGELGIGMESTSERICSDTLFSSWVNAYARLFGKDAVEELLKHFLNSNPVQMSSTFIYRHKGDRVLYYLPRPLNFPINYPADDLPFFKTYKKLKYLPLDVWQRWYQGDGFTLSDREELVEYTNKRESSGALQKSGTFDYGKTYKTNLLPKVAVDRVTAATNFYHTGFVQFQQEDDRKSGLYFLLQFPEPNSDLENRLHGVLNLMAEEGMGGERSSGAGRFRIEAWSDLPPEWQDVVNFQAGNSYCLLSLFWRSHLGMDFLENASYEIRDRGGWIGSPFSGVNRRRKKVKMFAEGSVFSSRPEGQLADVTPWGFDRHHIYRNGISLSLPIQ